MEHTKEEKEILKWFTEELHIATNTYYSTKEEKERKRMMALGSLVRRKRVKQ